MAEALLQKLVANLSSLIQDEIGLIMGVDEEMNKLFSTLTTIQAVLEDAEMKQLESRAIHNWLLKLTDLTYEIDDILDECATESSILKHKNSTYSQYSLKKILFRRKIGRRMKEVAVKLDAVAAERAKFHLREIAVERPHEFAATRETGSTLNESHLVYGREEDAEKIVDILVNQVNDNQEISVLPIIGLGGLGKTTLAQLVYKDQRVVEHFDKRIWVCVSDNFDLKALLKAMIESGSGSASDLMNLDALENRLLEFLNNKKYLLVLDDVWNDDHDKWSKLRNVLSCGSNGSSIIVTTRLKKVADITRTLPPHHLMGLSDDHCWMLLQERAFGHEKNKFPKLEAIGKQIVHKCAGVPMAAKALGGLLRFKTTEKEWNYVKESEIWELPQEETSILPALRLSYNHLPVGLRQCFAYCAVFPKDSHIQKEKLIFMWMAHGYISSKGVLEVEDVGNEVCNELVLRSLLQYVPNRNETVLIMHDLVHDLAQSIMENKVTGTQIQGVQGNVTSAASNSNIRQVTFPMSNQSEKGISFILKNYCRLRVLDASKTPIVDLPSSVGNLKHLRHLNLSGTEIRSLPSSLCSLWNLQVLNLGGCRKLVVLPRKMRYLINLRHLFLENCGSIREMPPNIRELTCLRSLSLFVVGRDRGKELEELQWLNLGGKLTIRYLEKAKNPIGAKKANLAEKKDLRFLRLQWEPHNASKSGEEDIDKDEKVLEALEPHPNLETLWIQGFRGRCFPIWMSNSTMEKLIQIDISDCKNCLRLPQLGKLPYLKTLRINKLAAEYIIDDEVVQNGNRLSVHFPSLESLDLWYLPNLKGLLKEQAVGPAEAFPNLESLFVLHCSSLIILPPLLSLKTMSCSSLNLASLSNFETLTHLLVDIEENTTSGIAIHTLANFINLESLDILGAHELCLPEEGMRALNSLKKLQITASETMTCFPETWFRNLTSLEQLQIHGGPKVVELSEGIKHLHYLKPVELNHLPKMVRLPEALQHLSSLQSLKLVCLHQLDSLPDWLDNLESLKSLYISDCPKIVSIPDSIGGMRNLRLLCVEKCPELERRCERERGEDWRKIAHISRLRIGI